MTERSLLVDRLQHHSRHDAATEILLLSHEPIRWDLEEMERHLKEPYFTGQPQKIYIFYRWFEGYFCELVKLSHARTQRLLSSVTFAQNLSDSTSHDSKRDEELGGQPSSSSSVTPSEVAALHRNSPAEQQELLEREQRAARTLMQDVKRLKSVILQAQLDDRAKTAEELRAKIGELGVVLKRCMAVEGEYLAPWVRVAVDPEDARAALDTELQGELPPMGWMGLSMWLPWIVHAMERWCSPKDVADFRERLPWHISNLSQFIWEPLYMSSNWALLQSMADPLDEDDTAEYDDIL